MQTIQRCALLSLWPVLCAGCATVDITKTVKGFHSATRPADIEILMTKPENRFLELGTVATTNWKPHQTAKMHNAMRAKAAPLGANAILITGSGIVGRGNRAVLWTTGVAIRWKSPP